MNDEIARIPGLLSAMRIIRNAHARSIYEANRRGITAEMKEELVAEAATYNKINELIEKEIKRTTSQIETLMTVITE